ncbi:MAG: TonB-dependent receptor [Gammaproteobacteria bacterium]|nr:TonB-dependent receptor [Gammaproteobacteria bacterium]
MKYTINSLAIISGLSVSVTPLYAAEADLTVSDIEEVTVMGRGSIRSTQALPIDVIEAFSPATVALSMIDRLPGVSVANADAYGGDDDNSSLTIRGFDRDQIGFTVNGIPLGSSSYAGGTKPNRFLDTENIQSIKVNQGASSAGSPSTQALAGSVSYTSRGPEEESGTELSMTGGSDHLKRLFMRGDTGAILGGNTYAYASYSNTTYDHWMNKGADAGFARQHWELALEQVFGDGNALSLLYTHNDRDANNNKSVSVETWEELGKKDDGIHGPWTNNTDSNLGGIIGNNAEGWGDPREDDMFSMSADLNLSDSTTVQLTSYNHTQQGMGYWPWAGSYDTKNPYAPTVGKETISINPDSTTNLATMFISNYDNDRLGLTMHFLTDLGGHELSYGGWYENQDRRYFRTYHTVIDPAAGPDWSSTVLWYESDDRYSTKTQMAYIKDKFGVIEDQLELSLALTVQKADIDYRNARFGGSNNYNGDYTFAPAVGALYNFSDSTEFFASVTRNFKNVVDEQVKNTVEGVDTEVADSLDFGMRYQNDSVNLSATVYNIVFDNKITQVSYSVPPEDSGNRAYDQDSFFVNSGEQKSQGLEVAADFILTESFDLYLSASYSAGSMVVVDNATTNNRGQIESIGYRTIDNDQVSAFAELSFHSGPFDAAINVSREDERPGFADGDTPAPAYMLVGVNAAYELENPGNFFKQVRFSLNIHNALDRRYLSGVANQSGFYVGAERSASLNANFKF